MIQKMLGSLSEVLRGSNKPTKIITEQKNNFWKDCEERYFSIKLLKYTFELNIQSVKTSNTEECKHLSVHILFYCQIICVFKPIWDSVFSCVSTLQWTAL